MSILLTGSKGLIGSYLKSKLETKYDIIELDYNNIPSIDATNEKSVQDFFKNINKPIKYIINCIGIPDSVPLISKNILDIDYTFFKKMVDINLNSIFLIIKECYRIHNNNLKHIINISSLYSVVSPRLDLYNDKIKNPAYTASKHGLIGLTKHISVIFGKDNICVNCIAPGGVTETIKDNDFIEKYINQVPMKTTISFDEILKTINYLFEMNTITGQNIIIDGGYSVI